MNFAAEFKSPNLLTKVIMEFWIFTKSSSIINSQNQCKATNTEIK